jgi:hypothetical protein
VCGERGSTVTTAVACELFVFAPFLLRAWLLLLLLLRLVSRHIVVVDPMFFRSNPRTYSKVFTVQLLLPISEPLDAELRCTWRTNPPQTKTDGQRVDETYIFNLVRVWTVRARQPHRRWTEQQQQLYQQ